MTNRIPTKVGDVLILRANSQAYSTFAVGPVVTDGQEDFHAKPAVAYVKDRPSALAQAQSLVGTGGRVFFVDLDVREWKQLP